VDAQRHGLWLLCHRLIRLDQQGDELLDVGQQPPPGIGQDNKPRAAQEKRAAKVIFQLQDLPADRALADVEDLGGLTERRGSRHCQERLQAAKRGKSSGHLPISFIRFPNKSVAQ